MRGADAESENASSADSLYPYKQRNPNVSMRNWNALIAFSETADPSAPVEVAAPAIVVIREEAKREAVANIAPPPAPVLRLKDKHIEMLEDVRKARGYDIGFVQEFTRELNRREAKRFLDEEEHARVTSSLEVHDRLLDGEAALFDMPESPEVIWGKDHMIGWAKGQGTMLAGPTGLGKTTFAHNVLTRMMGLDESEFLGMPVTPTDAPILYLAMDRPIQTRQAFRRLVPDAPAARALVKDKLRMWAAPFPFRLLDDPAYMARWIQEQVPGCKTVVFDSVKDMTPGVSEEASGAAVQIAWQELVAMGVDFLALHHFKKPQSADTKASISQVYGSTWLTAGLGSVLTIDGKIGEGNVVFQQHKTVMEQIPELHCIHHYKTGVIELRDSEAPTESEALKAAGDTGATAEQIAAQCYASTGKAVLAKTRRKLNDLVKAGKAVKPPKPAGASAATPDTWVWVGAAGKWAALQGAQDD